MRNYIQPFLTGTALLALMASCDKNFETFEQDGFQGTPITIAASDISSEALPGQIKLKWKKQENPSWDYMQIKYHDPWTKKDVIKLVSHYTDSLLIENTLKRFGEYTFTFQAFNAAHQGGNTTEVKAVSGALPETVTVSKSEVKLSASQLSSNYPEPSEGPIANLIDGDVSTFFHTRWSSPQHDLPHYIQIDFKESHENFVIWYQNRQWSQACPQTVELQISDNGNEWETVKTITSGLPTGGSAEYTSELIQPGKTFTHFRFNVTKTNGNTKYFNMAEFRFYDAKVDIYDPETQPLD